MHGDVAEINLVSKVDNYRGFAFSFGEYSFFVHSGSELKSIGVLVGHVCVWNDQNAPSLAVNSFHNSRLQEYRICAINRVIWLEKRGTEAPLKGYISRLEDQLDVI